jgi:surface polysaccharide O-acyltransferase-like enzyme
MDFLFKNIGNANSSRNFFATQFFFLILFGFLGLYLGTPVCDKSTNTDCTYYLLIAVFVVSLVANIFLQIFQNSRSYTSFQNSGYIDKITGILEIIFAPVIAFFVHIIYQLLYGWPNTDPYMGVWYESVF